MTPTPFRPVEVQCVDPVAADDTRAALLWRFPEPVAALSSAPVGGGPALLDWVLGIGVTDAYARTDLGDHADDVARTLRLRGTGAALFTAANVTRVVGGDDGGVRVDATVGVTKPTWAADADDAHRVRDGDRWIPGTVNIVVQVPVALSGAAAVNAVITVTEAKTQALVEAGIPGTGTASDAVVVCWPPSLPTEAFTGPRSVWGARVARATHAAVVAGLGGER